VPFSCLFFPSNEILPNSRDQGPFQVTFFLSVFFLFLSLFLPPKRIGIFGFNPVPSSGPFRGEGFPLYPAKILGNGSPNATRWGVSFAHGIFLGFSALFLFWCVGCSPVFLMFFTGSLVDLGPISGLLYASGSGQQIIILPPLRTIFPSPDQKFPRTKCFLIKYFSFPIRFQASPSPPPLFAVTRGFLFVFPIFPPNLDFFVIPDHGVTRPPPLPKYEEGVPGLSFFSPATFF